MNKIIRYLSIGFVVFSLFSAFVIVQTAYDYTLVTETKLRFEVTGRDFSFNVDPTNTTSSVVGEGVIISADGGETNITLLHTDVVGQINLQKKGAVYDETIFDPAAGGEQSFMLNHTGIVDAAIYYKNSTVSRTLVRHVEYLIDERNGNVVLNGWTLNAGDRVFASYTYKEWLSDTDFFVDRDTGKITLYEPLGPGDGIFADYSYSVFDYTASLTFYFKNPSRLDISIAEISFDLFLFDMERGIMIGEKRGKYGGYAGIGHAAFSSYSHEDGILVQAEGGENSITLTGKISETDYLDLIVVKEEARYWSYSYTYILHIPKYDLEETYRRMGDVQ